MHEEWSKVELRELVQGERPITYGIVQPGEFVDEGVPLVRGGDYSDGWRALQEVKRVRPEIDRPYKRSKLMAGDLVMTIVGANTGNIAIVPDEFEGANITQTTARIAVEPNAADPGYVYQFLGSPFGQQQVRKFIKGGAQPGLNLSDVELFVVYLPARRVEQRRIAEILRTWDEAIEKTERLIERKEEAFAHLASALLSGHLRVTRKRSNWRSVSLTDVTTELTARNGGRLGTDAVMGVNKFEGMIPMKDHVRAADLSRYKVVPPAAFAYNPMRLNIGSLAKNEHGRDVLVSPDYVAFAANDGELDAGYFDHLRRTRLWSRFVESAGSGGVRVRIYYDDLADFGLDLPPIGEQREITAILEAARREIKILEAECGVLDKQKRGLMQKLLTGEWRVAVDEPSRAARMRVAHG